MNLLDQMAGYAGGSAIVMQDQANATIQVSQLIFNRQYWTGIQLTKIAKNVADQNLNLTELDIREEVINAYYPILINEELLRIIEENKDNFEEILRHTTDNYNAGLAERTDVDQLSINLSQLDNSKKVMERSLQVNFNTFRFLMGIESGEQVIFTDSLNGILLDIENENLWNSTFHIDDNPSYQIALAQEQIGKKNVDMQKWAYAPTLVGFYSYREKILTTSFDLSPKNAAGLTLSVPIFSGGSKKAQVSKAKIKLDMCYEHI